MPGPSLDAHKHTSNLIGHKIDNDRLVFLSVLGVGAYGVVYLAHDIGSETYKPMYYAVKCLSRVGLSSRERAFQKRELALHSIAGRHPHVVTLHKIIETPKIIYVILEYCAEGDLFGMMTERQLYIGNDELVRHVFLQIVEAVEYCHSIGIYHRDLKPENILCTKGGSFIFLADFGLASTEIESKDHGCGSSYYMSPECLGQTYPVTKYYSTAKNDIWSLGIILINLCCGRNPWKEASQYDDTFREYMRDPNLLQKILPVSDHCYSILKQVLTLNPSARMTLRELKTAVSKVETFTLSEEQLLLAELNRKNRVIQSGQRNRKVPPVPAFNLQIDTQNLPVEPPAPKRFNTSQAGIYQQSMSQFLCSSKGWQECLQEYFGSSGSDSNESGDGPETPDFIATDQTLEIATDDIDTLDLDRMGPVLDDKKLKQGEVKMRDVEQVGRSGLVN